MEEDGEREYDRLIWPIKTPCRMFGFWPDPPVDKDDTLGILLERCHQTISLIIILINVVSTTAESIMLWGENMNEMIECSLVSSAFYMTLVRILVMRIHKKDLEYILRTMRKDWKVYTSEQRTIVRNHCSLSFKFAKLFVINVLMTSGSFSIMPIIDMLLLPDSEEINKVLPFRGYYFFNHTTTPRFQITYVINTCMGFLGTSTIAGATTLSLVATIHGAAKFAVVKNDFKTFSPSDWNSKMKIGKCIRRHQECITYAKAVERFINILALAQFVISTGLLCFAGFQLTTMLEDPTRLIKYTSFINAATMELFIFSYGGQKLKTESEELADFVYSSNWVGCHSSLDIRFIMTRANKPCTITAGKFYDMCLESFLKVMSSSFSYFTVLLAKK